MDTWKKTIDFVCGQVIFLSRQFSCSVKSETKVIYNQRRTDDRRRLIFFICRAVGVLTMFTELYFRARRALRWYSEAVPPATEAMRAKRMKMNFIFELFCFVFWTTLMNRSDESCFYTVFWEHDPEVALLICQKMR